MSFQPISAFVLQGYKKRNAYIAAQAPLLNTVGDFWRMIWEFKSKCIVMLCDLTEGGTVRDTHPPTRYNRSARQANCKGRPGWPLLQLQWSMVSIGCMGLSKLYFHKKCNRPHQFDPSLTHSWSLYNISIISVPSVSISNTKTPPCPGPPSFPLHHG